jgi:hypothetical protein
VPALDGVDLDLFLAVWAKLRGIHSPVPQMALQAPNTQGKSTNIMPGLKLRERAENVKS